MTMPDERYRALKRTGEFLFKLSRMNGQVPTEVWQEAVYCLRHYPGEFHLKEMEENCPNDLLEKR